MAEVKFRMATVADSKILAEHHVLMFQEILSKQNKPMTLEQSGKMFDSCITKYEDEIPQKRCVAWLMEFDGKTVGSGAVSIISMTPQSTNPDKYLRAYLHSVYVCKEYRGNGFTKLLLKEVEIYCRANGLEGILLAASDAGRPIYESYGFEPIPNYMRFTLN